MINASEATSTLHTHTRTHVCIYFSPRKIYHFRQQRASASEHKRGFGRCTIATMCVRATQIERKISNMCVQLPTQAMDAKEDTCIREEKLLSIRKQAMLTSQPHDKGLAERWWMNFNANFTCIMNNEHEPYGARPIHQKMKAQSICLSIFCGLRFDSAIIFTVNTPIPVEYGEKTRKGSPFRSTTGVCSLLRFFFFSTNVDRLNHFIPGESTAFLTHSSLRFSSLHFDFCSFVFFSGLGFFSRRYQLAYRTCTRQIEKNDQASNRKMTGKRYNCHKNV